MLIMPILWMTIDIIRTNIHVMVIQLITVILDHRDHGHQDRGHDDSRTFIGCLVGYAYDVDMMRGRFLLISLSLSRGILE